VESHIANDLLNGNHNRKNGVNKKIIEKTMMAALSLKLLVIEMVPLNPK